ncbi:MAG: hypothetical protein VX346_13430 [Planctomycetota bacterium]|nr:hypothetical protein [Planctomycetota bacterium]
MMKQRAQITSFDALTAFRGGILEFDEASQAALESMALEVRKAVDWIEHDRAPYWPAQVRQASDALVQARADLARCEVATRPDERNPCTEQKKRLAICKQRLRYCERKVEAVKHWRRILNHECTEFMGRVNKLSGFLETELPRAVATLERLLRALEDYTQSVPLPARESRLSAATSNPTSTEPDGTSTPPT